MNFVFSFSNAVMIKNRDNITGNFRLSEMTKIKIYAGITFRIRHLLNCNFKIDFTPVLHHIFFKTE